MSENNDNTRKQLGDYRLVIELSSDTPVRSFVGAHISPLHTKQLVLVTWFTDTTFSNQQEKKRFLQNSLLLKQLHHPYILSFLAASIDPETATPYIVTEQIRATSLEERWQQGKEPPFSQEKMLLLISQIGLALSYAHAHNVTHGNLTPQNIYLRTKYDMQLANFHLALPKTGTHYGMPIHTPYTPPEQNTLGISQSGDQYALGSIAYQLLTGCQPFTIPSTIYPGDFDSTSELIAPRELNPALSPQIEAALLTAMAPKPAQRYPHVKAFLTAMGTPIDRIDRLDRDNSKINIIRPAGLDTVVPAFIQPAIETAPAEILTVAATQTNEINLPAPANLSSTQTNLPAEADLPTPASLPAESALPIDANLPLASVPLGETVHAGKYVDTFPSSKQYAKNKLLLFHPTIRQAQKKQSIISLVAILAIIITLLGAVLGTLFVVLVPTTVPPARHQTLITHQKTATIAVTPTSSIPTPTSVPATETPEPVATPIPTDAPIDVPAPLPAPAPIIPVANPPIPTTVPTSTPTTAPTPTPKPLPTTPPTQIAVLNGFTVAPAQIKPGNCALVNNSYNCTVTLSLSATTAAKQNWLAYSTGINAQISPLGGTLSPGASIQLNVIVHTTCSPAGTPGILLIGNMQISTKLIWSCI